MKPRYKYSWQQAYLNAVSDVNVVALHTKISAARKVLDERVAELLMCRGGSAERLAIIDALFSLHFLEMHRRHTS
jgi:hypothetical protein